MLKDFLSRSREVFDMISVVESDDEEGEREGKETERVREKKIDRQVEKERERHQERETETETERGIKSKKRSWKEIQKEMEMLNKGMQEEEMNNAVKRERNSSPFLSLSLLPTWQESLSLLKRDIQRVKHKRVLFSLYHALLSRFALYAQPLDALQLCVWEELGSCIVNAILGLVPSSTERETKREGERDSGTVRMLDELTDLHVNIVEDMHRVLVLKERPIGLNDSLSTHRDSEMEKERERDNESIER
jgi:hypothetical protein